MPFAVRSGESTLGFIPIEGDRPTRRELFAGQSFLRRYGSSKILFVTSGEKNGEILNERMIRVPAETLLFD